VSRDRPGWPKDRRDAPEPAQRRCGAGVLTCALRHGSAPVEITTDKAPVYPRVVEDAVCSARHMTEQYANAGFTCGLVLSRYAVL
jgi:hypothetical protein